MEAEETKQAVFYEVQYFRNAWVWFSLVVLNAIFVYLLVEKGGFESDGMNKSLLTVILAAAVANIVLLLLIYFVKLESSIGENGVNYRLLPFHRKYRRISWQRISSAYVREYRPIFEYGGFGWRFSITGKGQALNVSGNQGLQLEYDNGKKLLIGTQQPDEIRKALELLKPKA